MSVVSDSVWPHGLQPFMLLHPWDSPGKNTGMGFHFLLQCMKVESKSEVTQSGLTLSDPMDCSLPGSSIHGIFPGNSTGVGCHCLLRHICLYIHKIQNQTNLEIFLRDAHILRYGIYILGIWILLLFLNWGYPLLYILIYFLYVVMFHDFNIEYLTIKLL